MKKKGQIGKTPQVKGRMIRKGIGEGEEWFALTRN